MKSIVTLSLTLSMLLASAALADDKKSAPASQTLTLPAGAVEAGPSTWKYTDAEGKKWIYRKSPFGMVRVEESSEVNKPNIAGVEERTKSWKVTDQGDKVSFENPSPFGPQRWTRKKSELTDDEKVALQRSQRESAKPVKAGGKN
jgi:hypothetical protein